MLSSAIKEFDAVIIHKLDRFGRNLMNNVKAISLLEDNGIKVESVTENFMNDASGRLMRNLLSSYGQFFSESLAAETMKGLKENAYELFTYRRATAIRLRCSREKICNK